MASKTRTILGLIKTALAGITGGSYVHDLSATGQIQIGKPTPADGRMPCIWISVGKYRSDHGLELGGYRRELTIQFEARAPVTAETLEEHQLIGADLLDDICTAVEGSRTWSSNAFDSIVQGAVVFGDEAGFSNLTVVKGTIITWWLATSAEGV